MNVYFVTVTWQENTARKAKRSVRYVVATEGSQDDAEAKALCEERVPNDSRINWRLSSVRLENEAAHCVAR